jgi:hypothetical protein
MEFQRFLKHLPAQEFERLADKTNLGELARSMARAHLVDGLAVGEVAKENGRTHQWVRLSINTIERAFLADSGEKSAAIVEVNLNLPVTLARELSALSDLLARNPPRSKSAIADAVAGVRKAIAKLIP